MVLSWIKYIKGKRSTHPRFGDYIMTVEQLPSGLLVHEIGTVTHTNQYGDYVFRDDYGNEEQLMNNMYWLKVEPPEDFTKSVEIGSGIGMVIKKTSDVELCSDGCTPRYVKD